MTRYIPIHIRAKAGPAPNTLFANTCSGNDTAVVSDPTNWTWANPTNTTTRVPIAGTSLTAASTECAWQETKVLPNTPGLRETPGGWFLSETDFLAANGATLNGNRRRGKGWRPIGAWVGADRPLLTDPAEARRAIYLPAYAAQLAAAEQHPGVAPILAHAATHELVYLRDHNTGAIEGQQADGARLPARGMADQPEVPFAITFRRIGGRSTLGKPLDFTARLARLEEPHIAPLTNYARRLNLTGRGFVPFFDPLDGGVNASVLFLMEKAGPTAPTIPIVSFDGANAAAMHARQFRTEARISREWTVVWNLMPFWDGNRKYTASDRQAGMSELPTLFALLPKLRVVVLVGAQAAKAKVVVEALGLAVITSAHPSMLCRNGNPELFRAIPGEWAKVHRFVG